MTDSEAKVLINDDYFAWYVCKQRNIWAKTIITGITKTALVIILPPVRFGRHVRLVTTGWHEVQVGWWLKHGRPQKFDTLRPRQNVRHFPDDSFKWIFLNENAWISIEVSLKFVPKGPINNIPALVQIMAWRRPGDKPLSEPMLVSLLTHTCVTRPQWVTRCWARTVP